MKSDSSVRANIDTAITGLLPAFKNPVTYKTVRQGDIVYLKVRRSNRLFPTTPGELHLIYPQAAEEKRLPKHP